VHETLVVGRGAGRLDECAAFETVVWDLGANTGRFSRISSGRGIDTVAFDIDPACVERNYREARRSKQAHRGAAASAEEDGACKRGSWDSGNGV
jgi:ribosomal protein L11 methylase PrmA